VSQARGEVRTTRTALELQLTDNVLTLAREFKGQPAKARGVLQSVAALSPVPPIE
jgi:hypothetical protein